MSEEEGYCRGGATDADGLNGAAEGSAAEQAALEGAEEGKCDESDDDRDAEGGEAVFHEHVGCERDEAAGNVGEGDGESGAVGLIVGGLFEAELETHHEVDPGGGILFECGEDGLSARAGDMVLLEDFVDLFLFVVGSLDDLALLAEALGVVVIEVSPGGEVSAKAHGDGAGGDLREAGEDDEVGGGDGSGETRSEGEGDGEAVGEADDGIPDGLAGLEVLLIVDVRDDVRVKGACATAHAFR